MEFQTPSAGTPPVLGAKVDQVARVLGAPVNEVLRLASEAGCDISDKWLDDACVRTLLAAAEPRVAPPELTSLVAGAFELARKSGKPDWQLMQVSVLKNRLLALTDNRFDETDYGYPNLHYMVRDFPRQLEVIPGHSHPVVRYLQDVVAPTITSADEQESVPATQPIRSMVRTDLWLATLDYKSGDTYVWDRARNTAAKGVPSSTAVSFPTADVETLRQWRTDFLASITADVNDLNHLNSWETRGGATILLPAKYRGLWNAFLRDRVVERVSNFFVANHLDLPRDLIEARGKKVKATTQSALRDRLHSIIDLLSEEELEQVTVPIASIVRLLPPAS
jgi:hypothetical protein